MKIYQIAGKQYVASGDDLYEKVPEFSPTQEIIKSIDEEKSASTFALRRTKKQIRSYVPKQTYKKGVCGKCGEEGHSAWHCPQRSLKKKALAVHKSNPKTKTKYDPDEVVTLARRVANKGMTAQEAADKLGVGMAMWYYLRSKYAGETVAKQKPEERVVLNADEIREKVIELQETGATSLTIAQKLKVPLSTVNKYWIHDRLAPATDADAPDTEDVEPEEETDEII
jgi:hypothetical protein